jgi:hypothetical protein
VIALGVADLQLDAPSPVTEACFHEPPAAGGPVTQLTQSSRLGAVPEGVTAALRDGARVVATDDGRTRYYDRSGWVWDLDRARRRASRSPWRVDVDDALETVAPLRPLVHWIAVAHDAAFVHGAVVADGSRAVLLLGAGGSGKSTTALACGAVGLRVLGDDYCVVTRTGQTYATYRNAKADATTRALVPGVGRLTGAALGSKQVIELPRLHGDAATARVAAVCVVHRHAETRLTPTTVSVAMRAGAPSTLVQVIDHHDHVFSVLASVMRAVPCFVLRVGDDPIDAATALTEIIGAT